MQLKESVLGLRGACSCSPKCVLARCLPGTFVSLSIDPSPAAGSATVHASGRPDPGVSLLWHQPIWRTSCRKRKLSQWLQRGGAGGKEVWDRSSSRTANSLEKGWQSVTFNVIVLFSLLI